MSQHLPREYPMTNQSLGRLERIDLRNIWASEAADFTPWLARAENLEVLGDTLGIDLELEAQEKFAGENGVKSFVIVR